MPGRHHNQSSSRADLETGGAGGPWPGVPEGSRGADDGSRNRMKRHQSHRSSHSEVPVVATHTRRRGSSLGGSTSSIVTDYVAAPVPPSLIAPDPPNKHQQFIDRVFDDGTQAIMLLTVLALLIGALSGFRYVEQHHADRPQQIHVAQGRDPTEMTVSFLTRRSGAPYVQYGTSDRSLDLRSSPSAAVTTRYSFVSYRHENYTSSQIHHVQLSGLQPDTTYFYVLRDEREPLVSPLLKFSTLPAVGSDSGPLSFGVVADLGVTNDSASTLQHVMDNQDLRMILHAGDLSYADCQGSVWDEYGELTQPLASTRPWMLGPGNHEIEQQPGSSDLYVPFEQRFRMPWVKPAQFGDIIYPAYYNGTHIKRCTPSIFMSYYDYGNSFFSFSAGLAHVIFLNPYTPTAATSRQYQWLAQDLASVDRASTPWVIIVTHCPLYSSNRVHYAEAQTVQMRANMEHLFYEYQVNIVIAGHVHAYERSHPVYLNATRDDGVTYVVIGDGGNAEGHELGYQYPQPSWSAFRNGTQYGHAAYTLVNRTHSMWQWHRNVDGYKVTRDQVYICNVATAGTATC